MPCIKTRIHTVVELYQPFPKQALDFTRPQYNSFENTVGKGEIARNEQFVLFPQCFLPVWWFFLPFNQLWKCYLKALSVWKSLRLVIRERVKRGRDGRIDVQTDTDRDSLLWIYLKCIPSHRDRWYLVFDFSMLARWPHGLILPRLSSLLFPVYLWRVCWRGSSIQRLGRSVCLSPAPKSIIKQKLFEFND